MVRVGEDGLEEPRPEGGGLLAELVVVGGRLPPVDDLDALLLRGRFDLLAGVVAPDEEHGQTVVLAEDGSRDGDQDARAVGRLGVGGHGAAVLHAGQAVECGFDDGPR